MPPLTCRRSESSAGVRAPRELGVRATPPAWGARSGGSWPSSGSTRSSVAGGVSYGRGLQLWAYLTALYLLDVRLQAEAVTQATGQAWDRTNQQRAWETPGGRAGVQGGEKCFHPNPWPGWPSGTVQTHSKLPVLRPKADEAPRFGSRTQSVLFQMVLSGHSPQTQGWFRGTPGPSGAVAMTPTLPSTLCAGPPEPGLTQPSRASPPAPVSDLEQVVESHSD